MKFTDYYPKHNVHGHQICTYFTYFGDNLAF